MRHLINGIVPCNAPPPDYFSMMKELHGIGNRLNLPTPNLRIVCVKHIASHGGCFWQLGEGKSS